MIRALVAGNGALLGLAACLNATLVSDQAGVIRVAVGGDDRYLCFVEASKAHAFAAYGLNVSLVQTTQDRIFDLVQGGAVDVAAIDVSSAVLASQAQPDLRLVAVDVSSNDFVKLWARAGAPDQPVLGTIGVVAGGSDDAATAHLMAARPGLEAFPVAAGMLSDAFKNATVDYAFASSGTADLAAAGARIVEPSADYGFSYEQGLIAQVQWLSPHTGEVRHLTEALSAGCRKAGTVQSRALNATLTLAVRAPSGADILNYTMELARHSGTPAQAATIVNMLVRQDLVSDSNTVKPGCDCQLLQSPTPPATSQ